MYYKDWIQNRAEDIEEDLFSFIDSDSRGKRTAWCYMVATEHYKDHVADLINAAYEEQREK